MSVIGPLVFLAAGVLLGVLLAALSGEEL